MQGIRFTSGNLRSCFPPAVFMHDQCSSVVVFIGERHVIRQVQSRHWHYLLCQETNSPRESFMQL